MKRLILLLILIVSMVALVNCGNRPQGEPKDVVEQYLQGIDTGDFEASYNLLSKENQSQITLDEFKDWRYQDSKVYKTGTSIVNNEEELSKYSYNGIDYLYAYKYDYSYKDYNYITEKDELGEGVKIVVSEKNKWKILDENNYRMKYAFALHYVGLAYREGKTFEKDLNVAIGYFLKAIEVDAEYNPVYYDLAYTYYLNGQYDKSLEYINIGIDKGNEEDLSESYNIKGVMLEAQTKIEEAKIAYRKALEIDPNNTYARDNLEFLE